MDNTPKSKGKNKLTCRTSRTSQQNDCIIPVPEMSNNNTSTPTQNKHSFHLNLENDYSPVYFPCTQEALEELDVVWDWNSPQSHKKKLCKKKRTYAEQSPKLTIKRHPSNNQLQTFDKLKSELQALKNNLACETNEVKDGNSLAVNLSSLFNDKVISTEENCLDDLEELFEDESIEEELFLCSQKVEKTVSLHKENNNSNLSDLFKDSNFSLNFKNSPNKSELRKVKSANQLGSSMSSKSNFFGVTKSSTDLSSRQNAMDSNCNQKPTIPVASHSAQLSYCNFKNWRKVPNCSNVNDSFDMALETFKEEDLELLNETVIPREDQSDGQSAVKNVSEPLRLPVDSCSENSLSSRNLQEIERKRMEALAKLEAKKKQGATSPIKTSPEKIVKLQANVVISPIKCSPEEIEKKRLEALAKLDAKKKQEAIEKNRQEALKRLQMNKKKRFIDSQRSLIARASR